MTTTNPRRRRIMKEFSITELGAVDRPAQAPALAVLLKGAAAEPENQMDLSKIAAFETFDAAVAAIAKAERSPSDLRGDVASRRTSPRTCWPSSSDAGDEAIAKAADTAKARPKPQAVSNFETLVAGIMGRDGCSKSEAMARARAEHPDAFAAYQAA